MLPQRLCFSSLAEGGELKTDDLRQSLEDMLQLCSTLFTQIGTMKTVAIRNVAVFCTLFVDTETCREIFVESLLCSGNLDVIAKAVDFLQVHSICNCWLLNFIFWC